MAKPKPMRCPRCGYDLTGLETEPCPECGLDQEGSTYFHALRRAETTAFCLAIIPGVVMIPMALAGLLFRPFGGFVVAIVVSSNFLLSPVFLALHAAIVVFALRILAPKNRRFLALKYLAIVLVTDLVMYALLKHLVRINWVT